MKTKSVESRKEVKFLAKDFKYNVIHTSAAKVGSTVNILALRSSQGSTEKQQKASVSKDFMHWYNGALGLNLSTQVNTLSDAS